MKIEFIRPWAHYSIGQTIDPPDGQAELMIQRGWCKKSEGTETENQDKKNPKHKK